MCMCAGDGSVVKALHRLGKMRNRPWGSDLVDRHYRGEDFLCEPFEMRNGGRRWL